jgi:predicted nucleotidyltransferase/DNA-binding transcriptional ArsR family regulator
MTFALNRAKREVLEKLAERDWTPTDLAEELDKSPETVYNHLNDLTERGVLMKTKVEAKTRPKTEYSIGNGFVQYITVLPGQFSEGTIELTESKEALFRIWDIPQEEFHPYLETYWWLLRNSEDVSLSKHVAAVAVYGSVARGEADRDSDIDLLVVAENEEAAAGITDEFGSILLRGDGDSRIGMTEVYTREEYRDSVAHGSDFLRGIRDELHVIYDPERLVTRPKMALQ